MHRALRSPLVLPTRVVFASSTFCDVVVSLFSFQPWKILNSNLKQLAQHWQEGQFPLELACKLLRELPAGMPLTEDIFLDKEPDIDACPLLYFCKQYTHRPRMIWKHQSNKKRTKQKEPPVLLTYYTRFSLRFAEFCIKLIVNNQQ